MTIEPVLNASPIVQFHLLAAVLAIVTGPLALFRKRRDLLHRVTGYVWVSAMFTLATSGFFLHDLAVIGPFGPVHLLSVFTIFAIGRGIFLIRARRIADHARWMRNFYWNALGIAGIFTLLPGRALNRVIFDGNERLGYWAIGLLLVAVIGGVAAGRLRRKPSASGAR